MQRILALYRSMSSIQPPNQRNPMPTMDLLQHTRRVHLHHLLGPKSVITMVQALFPDGVDKVILLESWRCSWSGLGHVSSCILDLALHMSLRTLEIRSTPYSHHCRVAHVSKLPRHLGLHVFLGDNGYLSGLEISSITALARNARHVEMILLSSTYFTGWTSRKSSTPLSIWSRIPNVIGTFICQIS